MRHLLRDLMKPWGQVLGIVCGICVRAECRGVGNDLEPFQRRRVDALPPVQRADIEGRLRRYAPGHQVAEFGFGIGLKEHVVVDEVVAAWCSGKAEDACGKAAWRAGGDRRDMRDRRTQCAGGQRARVARMHQHLAGQACTVTNVNGGGAIVLHLDPGDMGVGPHLDVMHTQQRGQRLDQLVHAALHHPDTRCFGLPDQ